MKMKQFLLLAAMAALLLPALYGCGGKTDGPAEKILSKKAYSKLVREYKEFSTFQDGVCVVKKDYGKYGAINIKGKEIISADVLSLSDASDGMLIAENKEGQYGAYNTKGKLVLPFQYSDISTYQDGYARIATGGWCDRKFGYANKAGKEIIAPRYDDAAPAFKEGMAYVGVSADGHTKYGYINTKGVEVIAPFFSNAENFSESLAAVRTDQGYGYIDKKGDFVTAVTYDSAADFSDGLAVIEKNDKYFVINKKDEIQITFPDDMLPAGAFHDGLIVVCRKDKQLGFCFGYMGKNGQMAIPFDYVAADGFRDGKAMTVRLVDKKLEAGYINRKGKVQQSISSLDGLESLMDFAESFEPVDEPFSEALSAAVLKQKYENRKDKKSHRDDDDEDDEDFDF